MPESSAAKLGIRNTSATVLEVHETRYNRKLAKDISDSDDGRDIYIAKVTLEDDICIKVGRTNNLERRMGEHRQRCKLDENEFKEEFHTRVVWAHRCESLLHHRLKAAGFTVSDAACECGTHHIERYASTLESLRSDVDEIKSWIGVVREL
ncbi:hypothetical protein V5O48_012030 [Marasmius crinis-equi]|uniref:Bacteriophage T5 Orf172 DNA-binding domain-containing protein n=1 Tax=Marasmius crinis-equi TaxID=585013 RepID=A0ABR3F3Y1_9AGAR